jgi:ATP-dependent Clp protease ATP-binding subunit ClpX
MGFQALILTAEERTGSGLMTQVHPEDLIKYGMIPEFVGRVPVVATLNDLDDVALVEILRQPKNALIKQYQKLFDFENVKLKFTDGALWAIGKEAIRRKMGARGLRAILEEVMLDVMYEIPSRKNVRGCVINEEVIVKREKPILELEKEVEVAS